MTRFKTPEKISPFRLQEGHVFLYGNKEWVFKEHRRTRSAVKSVADGRNYTIKIMDMDTVTVVGVHLPKTTPTHTKVVTKTGQLIEDDLFVTVGNNKRKTAELFRFIKYGTKPSIIHAKTVIEGEKIRIKGFDVIKVTDLPF